MLSGILRILLNLLRLTEKNLVPHIAVLQKLRYLTAQRIFNQLTCQLLFQLFFQFLVFWKQRYRFDVHQTRRHLQKLAGNLHLPALNHFHISKILFQQFGNFNIIDIELMFGNQL